MDFYNQITSLKKSMESKIDILQNEYQCNLSKEIIRDLKCQIRKIEILLSNYFNDKDIKTNKILMDILKQYIKMTDKVIKLIQK